MRLWLLFAVLTRATAGTYFVTVAGLGGEPEYEQRFASLAKEIDGLLKQSAGALRIDTLSGPSATKARITETLQSVSRAASRQDSLVLMLIGHGTFDGVEYKFNLPGPDLSASELAGLLDAFPGPQLVVNMTSASGGSLAALKKPGRAVIMATKSGTERNATVFARYWAEALRDPSTDTDKNEIITALEAYRYAVAKTVAFYERAKRLATEHAQLEDTGSGEAVREPSPENGQGALAARFGLLRIGKAQLAANTPEKRKLLERKEQLEQQIAQLKYQKAAMASEQYRKQLSGLLVELAQVQAEIDK
ncbi:MAG: hypothetical protein NZV14_01995 [Bryobacteraceae bacterium]|nr:hypothetical protein [Bryobacteraceae bacterium]MDW8376901.1 hypothetical protein [Bryobacterales bacterium]